MGAGGRRVMIGAALAAATVVGVPPAASAHDGAHHWPPSSPSGNAQCSPILAPSHPWFGAPITVHVVRAGLDATGAQLVEVRATSQARPGRAATVVCGWVDGDLDGVWDPGIESVVEVSGRPRWDRPHWSWWSSVYATELAVPGGAAGRVCVSVSRPGAWPFRQVGATDCVDAEPPVDVPEVPVAPLLGVTGLGTAVLAGGIARRRSRAGR